MLMGIKRVSPCKGSIKKLTYWYVECPWNIKNLNKILRLLFSRDIDLLIFVGEKVAAVVIVGKMYMLYNTVMLEKVNTN